NNFRLISMFYFQSGRKETVLDLAKFVDKGVQVKLTGGRQEGLVDSAYVGCSDVVYLYPVYLLISQIHPGCIIVDLSNLLLIVTGTLKGYDQLLNLVLDEAIEFLRDPDDPLKNTDQTRRLGLIVCRGTAVMLVSPTDGTDEIANPFIQPDGA
ncbi:hypothetical protein IFM89_011009, partial [Coptis chinensis]